MESNQLITMTELKQIGLQPKGSIPADSSKCVTKGELISNYYIDPSIQPLNSYPNNRLITAVGLGKSLLQKPSALFYQYTVVRSGIPNCTGCYFTYIGTDFQSHTIVQDTYGTVGTFCMQDGSYMNNQYNVYTFTLVGVCMPDYGTTYPKPLDPQSRSGSLQFTSVSGYEVHNIKLYKQEDVTPCTGGGISLSEFVCAVRSAWDALFGTALEGGTTNVLKYSQSGLYTNGTLSLSQFPAGIYFVTYDVVNISGGFTVYQYLDSAQAPGFTLNN